MIREGAHQARTEEEKEAVYRFRYEVYVAEMGRYRSVADHKRRLFREPEDDSARIFYVAKEGEVLATSRFSWGGDAPFTERLIDHYDLTRFLAEIPAEAMVVGERGMVKPEVRGSPVFTELGMGVTATTVSVDAETIMSLDINPDDGRSLGLSISGDEEQGIRFVLSPLLDVRATLAWQSVSSDIEDLPSFLLDESLGVLFNGSATPTLDILRSEDSTDVRVSLGQLTLWSSEMSDDVVIGEGECITGVDEETLTQEEIDAQHDLFGGLMGETCKS